MKLRYLVILPDPASRIWPEIILDKWRKYMTIVEWKDEDFMTPEQYIHSQLFRTQQNHSKRNEQGHHNRRQTRFLRQCALHMKETGNQTWVSFHDVDEYYVVNHRLVRNSSRLVQEPSSGFRLLQDTNHYRKLPWSMRHDIPNALRRRREPVRRNPKQRAFFFGSPSV
jgi:hypothetical protein